MPVLWLPLSSQRVKRIFLENVFLFWNGYIEIKKKCIEFNLVENLLEYWTRF